MENEEIPKKYKWKAQDEDGDWYVYVDKPTDNDCEWGGKLTSGYLWVESGLDRHDWKGTLTAINGDNKKEQTVEYEEMIAIIEAHMIGVPVQHRGRRGIGGNEYAIIPRAHQFNFSTFEYRVEPQTVVEYLNIYQNELRYSRHISREMADSAAGDSPRVACIRIEYTEGDFDD